MTIKPQNPSINTIILTWSLALRRKTVTLRESLLARALRKADAAVEASDDAQERLEWSIRQDLEDEADELRAVISDCNKVKAQAEDRLTSILNYLDPDAFYSSGTVTGRFTSGTPSFEEVPRGTYTPRPQVPDGAGLAAPAEKVIDEDDAPEGYKAVPWYSTGVGCRDCAFASVDVPCPRRAVDDSLHCSDVNRPDGIEVKFHRRG